MAPPHNARSAWLHLASNGDSQSSARQVSDPVILTVHRKPNHTLEDTVFVAIGAPRGHVHNQAESVLQRSGRGVSVGIVELEEIADLESEHIVLGHLAAQSGPLLLQGSTELCMTGSRVLGSVC
jgi:hypothetical protein